jgi:flagellar biosynthetic protein FlhB
MTILAGIDYAYQRWELEKKMKMTKQEVKEEVKSREGDPQIKARIRRIQRDMATKRMMEDVPKADVIITNPTHIAVALKYSADLPAPKLLAKGADLVAEKIKEVAKEHRIPIVENKPLARTIYKTLKIGHVIPRELFNAVAEVLAYVYKLKRKVRR